MSVVAGIDLGTTNSALAVLNEIGKPEIIPNADGDRITPSVVAVDPELGTVLVGKEAKERLKSDNRNVVQFAKRNMGDPSYRYLIGGKEFSPVEISSFILKKLKEECIQEGEIRDVVITVPAQFNDIQRRATRDAGKIAGLNVLGVVNEPTAAAIYYSSLETVSGKVAVYDLGGGTFDVTIMEVNGDSIEILSSKGTHIGGVNFDNSLTEFIAKKAAQELNQDLVQQEMNIDSVDSYQEEEGDLFFKFMLQSEKQKKQLSAKPTAQGRMTTPFGNIAESLNIERSQFEELISADLLTTEMLLENALEDAGLNKSEIDKVILVGGSTRIPRVSSLLAEFFGFAPEKAVNPDEAVALGAAIMAGIKQARKGDGAVSAAVMAEVGKRTVLERTSHFFGTVSVGHNVNRGEVMEMNSIIIRGGTKLPCEGEGDFSTIADGQKQIRVRVTQSENEVTDFSQTEEIGSWLVELPPNCPAGAPIKITYSYSEDEILTARIERPDGKVFQGNVQFAADGSNNQSELRQSQAKVDDFIVE